MKHMPRDVIEQEGLSFYAVATAPTLYAEIEPPQKFHLEAALSTATFPSLKSQRARKL
jgi:hypothetical protein